MKKYFVLLIFFIVRSLVIAQVPDKYVILVIIDGARYSETLGDSSGQFIPRMKSLSLQGVVIDSFINDGVTVTKRGVPAIWCGSWSQPKDTIINGFSTQYATVPTVWEYFRKTHSTSQTQAMYILKNLNGPWLPSFHPEYGESFWPWYILEGERDINVWQNAKSKLETYHPRLSVIYLADVDHFAHSGNWQSYTNSIMIADSIVGLLWDFVQKDSSFKNKTNIFITNDHGRHLNGISSGFIGHGDGCWGCRHIMFLAIGNDVKRGIRYNIKKTIPDIVPTIGKILNFSTPYSSGSVMTEILTEYVSVETRTTTKSFLLFQNYPNPFNACTNIKYHLPASSVANRQAGIPNTNNVTLKVYDILGREVAVLVDEVKEPGSYEVKWTIVRQPTDRQLPSGVYIYRVTAGDFVSTKKMILQK